MITVEGKKYKVADKGAYSHDLGSYWKIVTTPQGERTVVGRPGLWRFYTPAERVAPLKKAIEEGWPNKK
jgi:hypothetical protein